MNEMGYGGGGYGSMGEGRMMNQGFNMQQQQGGMGFMGQMGGGQMAMGNGLYNIKLCCFCLFYNM